MDGARREGWKWGDESSGERVEGESWNERYIASGKQKTIVTPPPITHFNLKQQIFFTQLISTHWSRGLGGSWAFMCSCRCEAFTHFLFSFLSALCLSLSLSPISSSPFLFLPLSLPSLRLSKAFAFFLYPPLGIKYQSALEWTETL